MNERTVHMPRTDNLYELPPGLPIPLDDGACDHLTGMSLPAVLLASTAGRLVDLASFGGRTVVYGYPRTGRPDQKPPVGVPSACTSMGAGSAMQQSAAFPGNGRLPLDKEELSR